ncbi:MAG: hypothetical protein GAK30_03467 [Paracidovorax wautersii]|uniref:Gloeo_Verruco repeat-containing protein n=1 Tax=Paracidovorax wautersii TaxID=1177982 RepID=A0A7V8FL65_9BURK|nr:MAG: hypothetical protein GAK30_03467 [Paracidovorax wautersii]
MKPSFASPRPRFLAIALGLSVLAGGAQAQSSASDFAPRVLHRFSVAAASVTGQDGQAVGLNPHLPPIYNPVDGKLYGVTPSGGGAFTLNNRTTTGGFSVAYRFTPATSAADAAGDYAAVGSAMGGVSGFYTGLVSDPQGIVYGGSYPSVVRPDLDVDGVRTWYKWAGDGWPEVGVTNADASAEFGGHFRPRGLPAVDPQGNVYFGGGSGRAGMALFRRDATGALVMLVNFMRADYVVGTGNARTVYTKGQYPVAVIYSADGGGTLYGITLQTQSGGAGDTSATSGETAAGTVFRVRKSDFATDGTSQVDVLHTFAATTEGGPQGSDAGQSALIEDGDWLYGTTSTSVWRLNKNDPANSFTLIRTFGAGDGDGRGGYQPWGPLVRAEDGNIYGTTSADWRTVTASVGVGAGTLYRIITGTAGDRSDDTFELLHHFDAETEGARPVGLSAGPVVGGTQTLFGAARNGGATGNAAAQNSTGLGTVFAIDVAVPQAGTVSLTAAPASVTLGSAVQLNWSSTSTQSCEARGDGFTGSKDTHGSESITPSAAGSVVYTLSCVDELGETVSASTTVTVTDASSGGGDSGDNGDGDSGESGGGGGALAAPVLALLVLVLTAVLRRGGISRPVRQR